MICRKLLAKLDLSKLELDEIRRVGLAAKFHLSLCRELFPTSELYPAVLLESFDKLQF